EDGVPELLAQLTRGHEHQVLEDRHALLLAWDLERTAQSLAEEHVWRQAGHVLAVEEDRGGGRLVATGEEAEQRGLAGAVRANEAGYGSRSNVEGAVVHGPQASEVLHQTPYAQ